MKILYQLEITKETGFSADDFPDRFEILRKDKTPLVFKPCALNVQEMYNRLNEAEEILKSATALIGDCPEHALIINKTINEYFDRYSQ